MTPEQLAEYRRLASDTQGHDERHPLWANIAILKLVDEVVRLQAEVVRLQAEVVRLKARLAADAAWEAMGEAE